VIFDPNHQYKHPFGQKVAVPFVTKKALNFDPYFLYTSDITL